MILALRRVKIVQSRRRRRIARVHRIVIDKVHAWGGVEICALFYVRADPSCTSCCSDTNVGVCVGTAMEAYHQVTLAAIRGMEEARIKLANYGGDSAGEEDEDVAVVRGGHHLTRSARLSCSSML